MLHRAGSAAFALVLMLSGCSGTAAVNALVPRSGYEVAHDLAYGDHPRQRLDLYTPAAPDPSKPLIVFFYGGRWQDGAKEDFLFVAEAFLSRGYPVAVPDYRLYPEVRWRGFLADGAAALAYLASGDAPRALVVAGHSAGAYIAAMTALDQELGAAAGLPRCAVAGGVGLAGPYNFLPLTEADIIDTFGPGTAGAATQPITFADAGDPPMLLLTGADDDVVDPRNAASLAAFLRAVGVPATARSYRGIGHIGLSASLAAPLRFLASTLDDIDAFVAGLPRDGCAPPL